MKTGETDSQENEDIGWVCNPVGISLINNGQVGQFSGGGWVSSWPGVTSELEQGEAEVIILAKEKGIKHVLIDEKVARLQAKVFGLEVIGTLGVLLKAKKKGLIPAIKPHVQKMLEHGIWIKDEIIVEGILKESGEKS